DVLQLPIVDVSLQKADHVLLNVLANDFARRTNDLSHSPNVVTHAGADISHYGTFLDIECGKHAIRIFLSYAFRTREPIRAGGAHHGRRLAPGLRLGLSLSRDDKR